LSESFQCCHRYSGPQVNFALRRPAEDLERRGPLTINAPPLAVGLFDYLGHGAGPMKVDVGIQIPAMKPIDSFGVLCANVTETHVFANDRSVFRLHQPVVSRAMGA
jgi:hypothetical protein